MNTHTATQPNLDSAATRHGSTDGRSTIERLEAAAPHVAERIEGLVHAGSRRVEAFGHEVKDGIRRRPVQTFLMAAALGAVVGLLLGRSRA